MVKDSQFKGKVRIKEVGPRDGLQNERTFISTADKIHLIEKLSESGLDYIEASSFVRPSWIPQLADASPVLTRLIRRRGVMYAALIPNLRGLQRALHVSIDEANIFMSASEGHNKANINKTIEETFPILEEVVKEAQANHLTVRGYVSTVIACPYDGPVQPEQVLYVVDRLVEMGVTEISLGDTIGVGVPPQIERLLELLLEKYPPTLFAMHFHDTYGTAIANIVKSLEMGIRIFDSSIGGLGGCPYAKGATGNVATEDVNYLLTAMGYETGLDHGKLLEAAFFIESKLGKPLKSRQLEMARGEVKVDESC
ncbi:hydroxymethylglutaryl-CoA lyase [Lysinibacillus yapensis]|uniref:Hydroxymethylglutaryl-CoA lyase n=1 Tax=Ureibacillus yapensis TaxID=2304605 RepID=A0A396SDT2_9BACL|nr:hydroxymethylglutaryl-CoA lyase [Lysinibacillus yapensis]RHW39445.1 hydroxymethylglutaryl-CoA lyase [Lysinibacillus yapensis]